MNIEGSVRERYTQGAVERQESLCCPVSYDNDLLALLPDEIIEKDYGCGDPSRYVQEGDTVLDLGSGGGKICYMAAQLVGKNGRVIGVDMNADMLALARKYQQHMADKLGNDRVSFIRGYIQDLALDLDALDAFLASNPVSCQQDYQALQSWEEKQRRKQPLIADNSVDLVISNCVLNLVEDREKLQLVGEIYRVLKPGGRVAIADIVSDKPVPNAMKDDAALWSGCVSGAFHEADFPHVFAEAGFHAVCYDKWETEPWQVIEGIAFRSVTLTAVKPSFETGREGDHTLIYRGPFSQVSDDAGNHYVRGKRTLVPERLHALLTSGPYTDSFIDPASAQGRAEAPCCGSPAATGYTRESPEATPLRDCCR